MFSAARLGRDVDDDALVSGHGREVLRIRRRIRGRTGHRQCEKMPASAPRQTSEKAAPSRVASLEGTEGLRAHRNTRAGKVFIRAPHSACP